MVLKLTCAFCFNARNLWEILNCKYYESLSPSRRYVVFGKYILILLRWAFFQKILVHFHLWLWIWGQKVFELFNSSWKEKPGIELHVELWHFLCHWALHVCAFNRPCNITNMKIKSNCSNILLKEQIVTTDKYEEIHETQRNLNSS